MEWPPLAGLEWRCCQVALLIGLASANTDRTRLQHVTGELSGMGVGAGGGGHTPSQTPSTGLRHPSLEEDVGKRCSECDSKPLFLAPYLQTLPS